MATVDPEAVRPAVVLAALAVEPEVLPADPVQVGMVQAAELVAVALPDLAQEGMVLVLAVASAVADNHLALAVAS